MNEQIFTAALAGLLFHLDRLAAWAGETSPRQAVAGLIPDRWRSVVAGVLEPGSGPPDRLAQIVQLADRLATGQPQGSASAPGQLLTIFRELSLPDGQGQTVVAPKESYLPLKALQVEATSLFPDVALTPSARDDGLKGLWQPLQRALSALRAVHAGDNGNQAVYLNTLLKLLERYTWSVPVTAGSTISLYDAGRIRAALAVCLINDDAATIDRLAQGQYTEPVVRLIGGDISGVQDFIYTITARGATGALRGRSMYLQLLTDVVARYLLAELDLPLTNLLYAGGGHFYLLAPAQEKTTSGAAAAQKEISRILLHYHQGDLYLALAEAPLQVGQLNGKPLSEAWQGLSGRLQVKKQQRFRELGQDMIDLLFKPLEYGGNLDKACSVCGREHRDTKAIDEAGGGEPIRKCPVCESFERLGDRLRQADFMAVDEIPRTDPPPPGTPVGDWRAVLAHFGYAVNFERAIDRLPNMGSTTTYREVLALKDAALPDLRPGLRQAVGRRFLVNVTPLLTVDDYKALKDKVNDLQPVEAGNEPVKPFDALAAQSEGIARLGVLRMDVDNLGKIFSTGLGERANLARIAALSSTMSRFFEGWVAHIAETMTGGHNRIYSIYSGGDDLFFVGSWDLMPRLAEQINADLKRYAADHPGIHLSGGIALAPAKYPLYQAADDAHQAEQAAKANKQPLDKNALNFLGRTIPWSRYADVRDQQARLVDLTGRKNGQGGLPRSLIRRLIQLYAEYDEAQQRRDESGESIGHGGQRQIYWGPGQWRAAYSLSRMARLSAKDERLKSEIDDVRQQLALEGFTTIEWIGLAARWAELLIRSNEEDQDHV